MFVSNIKAGDPAARVNHAVGPTFLSSPRPQEVGRKWQNTW